MYIISMDYEKNLIPTVRQPIYKGENLIDKIVFLLPLKYDDFDLSDFTVTIQYVKFGKIVHEEELSKDEIPYNESRLSYSLDIDSVFTKSWGRKEIQLRISKADADKGLDHVMKTSSCFVWVFPATEYAMTEEEEQDFPTKLEELNNSIEIIKEILKTKAEDIVIDANSKEIYLSVDGYKVGTGVTVDDFGNAIADYTESGLVKVLT